MNNSPFYLLYMKKGPFTEEEDQIIILCLKEATSPNISDVMRKASTLLGRSFSSVYQRYLTMGKPTLESLKKQKEEFEDWKLIISFLYNEPIKSWVTQYNYTNLFKKDWELLMNVVDKIEKLGYFVMINKWTSVYTGKENDRIQVTTVEGNSKIINTYQACIEFIKFWNKKNEKQSILDKTTR